MFPTVLLMAFVVDTSSSTFQNQVWQAQFRQQSEQMRELGVPSRNIVPEDMTRPWPDDDPFDLPRKPGDPPRKKIG